jgi:predicted dienelactone hydrolase
MRRLRAMLVTAGLLAGACATGDDAGGPDSEASSPASAATAETVEAAPATTAATAAPASTTAPPTTATVPTTAGKPTPATRVTAGFASRGPSPVGFQERALADRPVDLWFPATTAEGAPFVIDPTVTLPPSLAGFASALPAYLTAKTTTRAVTSAPPAPGPHPLVVYSHGFGGWRRESAAMLEHLASWGYVVAAIEHPERNQTAAFGGTIDVEAIRDVADIGAAIDLVLADPLLGPTVDPARIAAIGFSAGGRAAFAAVDADPRVAVAAGLAPAAQTAPARAVPSLILTGGDDSVVPLASVRQFATSLPSPSRLVIAAGAGHASFADICANIWDNGGLDTFVKSFLGGGQSTSLLAAAENGCAAGDPDPRLVVDLANQTLVAFLRLTWGEPGAAAELEPAQLAGRFPSLQPTVTSR